MAFRIGIGVTLFIAIMVNCVLSAETNHDIPARIECGKQRMQGVRFGRILGGHDSRFGAHPWQVLYRNLEFRGIKQSELFLTCGGALLTDRWIVTAASCVGRTQPGNLIIRLGEFDLANDEEVLRAEEYKVEKIEIHPKYNEENFRNDVALLKLERLVKFDRHIIPVCLPSEDFNPVDRMATVTGWGFADQESLELRPNVLQEVDVEVFSNKQCDEWFSESGKVVRPISESELCAGIEEGGKDACMGDAGGPLTTLINGRRILVGIVSWGSWCGRRHLPGVYARINHFVPWINNVTKY